MIKCATLKQLPPPPPGRVGWPWTEESPHLPDAMPDGTPWPRVSIVTPSYNQAHFIEETIRSVLLQGYPDLEYIVIDGGSTDSSAEIIRKYEPWLAYWVSEKDRGQAHAINKGWARATGQLMAWLNSDDVYEMAVFPSVADKAVTSDALVVYGNMQIVDTDGNPVEHLVGAYAREKLIYWWRGYYGISQPAAFFRHSLVEEIGNLSEDLTYIMDYEFLLRASSKDKFQHIDRTVTRFRLHDSSKTGGGYYRFAREHILLARSVSHKYPEFAQPGYFADMRKFYAGHLIGSVLNRQPADGRSATSVLLEALYNCPQFAKESWVRKLFVKSVLGIDR